MSIRLRSKDNTEIPLSLGATKLCGTLLYEDGTVFDDGTVHPCELIGTAALRSVAELLERCVTGTMAEACVSSSITGSLAEAVAVLEAAQFLAAPAIITLVGENIAAALCGKSVSELRAAVLGAADGTAADDAHGDAITVVEPLDFKESISARC